MYYTQNISQAFHQNFSFYLKLCPEFAKNVMTYLSEMTNTEFDILYELLKLAHDTKRVELAQETIARRLKVCRETVNRLIAKLEKWGLIDSRGHLYEVRRYRVNSWFLIPAVRLMLMKVFPALALNIQQFQKQNVTPIKSLSFFSYSRGVVGSRQVTSNSQSTKKIVNLGVAQATQKRESGSMNNFEPRDVIKNIKTVKLTQWGQIKLTAFPDAALEFAEQQMANYQGNKRFYAFKDHAEAWCDDHGFQPEWRKAKYLADQYGQPTSPRYEEVASNLTNRTFTPPTFQKKYQDHRTSGAEEEPKRGNSNQSHKIKPFQPVEEVITTAELEEDLNNFTALKNARAFLNQPAINGQDSESYFNRAFQNRQTSYVPHMTNPVEIADRKPIPDVSWIVKAWLDDKEMEVGRYGLERFIHRLEAQIILELHKAGREDARYKVIAEMRARFRYHEDVK